MVARPGRNQAAFTAGELSQELHERVELKYFSTGAALVENAEIVPQGGFHNRDGLRDIGSVSATAARLFAFDASDGSSYDLVFSDNSAQAWSATEALASFATGVGSALLAELTDAQKLDTMLLFHNDLETTRIKHSGPTSWAVDAAPFTDLPTYDYGDVYTNGVAAEWQTEFVGLENAVSVFTLTVSGLETVSIVYDEDMEDLAALIEAAILDLPNVSAGATAVSASGGASGTKIDITFDGAGNEGDGWAVTGRVINKTDAAILAFKTVPGVQPGEPIISSARGWPACGEFYGQRLLIGGFKALPNAWMFSRVGQVYSFDERFSEASGPALVPMDAGGGERVERIVANRNLLIFTSQGEYWIAERALSRTEAPNHVQSSRHGVKSGVPVVENEGAALFIHRRGGVLGEFRYTDVEGNFVARDISLLASHLLDDVVDMAVRRATASTDGHLLSMVRSDGLVRCATLLREQDVTAFSRLTTNGLAKAVSVNGRNEAAFIIERPIGRRLERLEEGLLLDAAVSFTYGAPTSTIADLENYEGETVWAIGDGNVFGPYVVSDAQINIDAPVSEVTVGYWSPLQVKTLPLPRTIGPNTVLKRRARIHSVLIDVIDTTSIAVGVNGGALHDVSLVRYGAPADVAELEAGYTGLLKLRGFTGYVDDATVTIGQKRPGRLAVRSITIEAAM